MTQVKAAFTPKCARVPDEYSFWYGDIPSFFEKFLLPESITGRVSLIYRLAHSASFRYAIISLSLAACLFLEWYFHVLHGVTAIYPHLFYIPILIASIYYGFKGGLYSSLFLALVHNQLFLRGIEPEVITRGVMMVIIGASSGYAIQLLVYLTRNALKFQEMYKSIVENISLPAVILQLGTAKVVFANQAFVGLTGMGEDKRKEIAWRRFVHPEDMEMVKAVRKEFRNSDESYRSFEIRLRDKTGKYHNMVGEGTRLPFFNVAIVSLKDVSENKKLKGETEKALAMFESLYENSPSAMVLTTLDEVIIKYNKTFRELFNVPEDVDLEGMSLPRVIVGEDKEMLEDFFSTTKEALTKEEAFEKEVVRRTWDGEEIPLLAKEVRFVFEGQECFFMTYQDLRELKGLSLENSQRMEMFKALFDHSPAALVLVGADRGIIDANVAFLDAFKIKGKEDVLGKPIIDTVLGAGDNELKEQHSRIHKKSLEEGYVRAECIRRRKDGQLIPVEVREVRVPYGNEYASLIQYSDLSEQKDREEKLQNANYHLSHTTENLIFTVSGIIESRDPYTSGHQKRVAELSRQISLDLALDKEEIRGIYFAGLLHDVGKIQVPAEILNKPGRLTQLEMDLIKSHPEAGFEMLKNVLFPWPVGDMIKHHHERLDGSGYPDGLKGESLSIGVRILAVADVMESMMSHRPYRPALGMDAALEELQTGAGIKYDPQVVDVCVRLFRQKGFSLD